MDRGNHRHRGRVSYHDLYLSVLPEERGKHTVLCMVWCGIRRMSKFLIEDDYYVVTLDNCYALGKYRGKRMRMDGKENDEMDLMCFHADVGGVLKRYCEIRKRKACAESCDGTIEDMIRILSSENKRLSERLKSLCEEIGE